MSCKAARVTRLAYLIAALRAAMANVEITNQFARRSCFGALAAGRLVVYVARTCHF